LYFIITYLQKPTKINLFVLFLISFFSAPSFYVETIFLVFFVAVLPFFVEFLKQQKHKAQHLKTSLLSLFTLVIPHLFWLLPVAFFVITNGTVPEQAKNNLLSSPETYARNLQFATLKDTALMKGYLFNYLDLGQDNKYTYLLSVWRSHLDISIVSLLGFLSFVLVLTGLYYSFKKRFAWTKSFVALLVLCLFFLLGGGLLVNNKIPLIGELFRSPFTKFSIPLSLAYSFFFSIGTIFLLDLFSFLHTRLTYYLTLFTVAFSLVLFMSPAFSGNLISPSMRQPIPQEYFELFAYMKTQDTATRVANFPQFSFWGWESYDWGYRGSGFLWYGLRQPLMDRAFDAWDKNSEKYYEEMSTALYSDNQNAFENILDKYSINWILIDEHLTLPENATDSGLLTLKKYVTSSPLWYGLRQPLMDRAFDAWDKNSEKYYEEMSTALYSDNQNAFENILDKYSINWILIDEHLTLPENATDSGLLTLKKYVTGSPKFSLDQKFGNKISLYQVALKDKPQNFISLQSPVGITHPFASLSLRPNTDWTKKGEYLNIASPAVGNEGDTLIIPSLTTSETLLPIRIEYQKLGTSLNLRLTPIIPTIFLDNSQIDLQTQPLTLTIPGTTGTGFILELDKNYFELQLPAEIDSFSDFYPLTTVYLPSHNAFSVSLFSSSEIGSYDLTDRLGEATPEQCYRIRPNRKVEKITTQNGISLIGTDVVGCLSATLPYTTRGNLISLAFTYSSPTLTLASVNISGSDLSAQSLPQPLETKEKPSRARIFTPSTGTLQQVNLLLEAGETRTVKEINYDNIEISVLPLIYSSTASLPLITQKNIVLKNKIERLQVSLLQTDTELDMNETPNSNSLFPESLNCDQWNNGKTIKQVTKDGFLYQSQNASECDILNLRHLPHSLNYLISFDYRFQKGLTPTVCLENHSSRRCDIHERLLKTNQIQSLIQPIANLSEAPGFTLHIYNQSFGNRITSNLIKSISLRPIPLQFLQDISLSSLSTDSSPTITNSTHPYPFLYTANIEGGQGSLSLYQTQSFSWKAIQVSPTDTQTPSWLLSLIVPFVSPFLPKLDPTSTSSWHNSWNLPEGNSNLILVYLPQYLEFFGLTLLVLAPIIALVIFLTLNRYQTKDE